MREPPSPVGLKAAAKHPPRRLQTTADLLRLQRLMMHALVRPLTVDDRLQPKWIDGRPMDEVASEFIKSNDRLTAFERLEIYNRVYWFRLIEAASDDCPGLRALLGERRYGKLIRAYLAKFPSRSFTLRNLCSRLPDFVLANPRLTAPRTAIAWDVARFEWAQTVAFDGEALPIPAPESFARSGRGGPGLGLQPYLSLLALNYPVDDYVIAVKRRDALRGEASNAVDRSATPGRLRRVGVPRRKRVYLAVHRHSGRLYYKRLALAEFRILEQLQARRPLARAIAAGGARVRPQDIQEWFALWTKLGWICEPPDSKGKRSTQ